MFELAVGSRAPVEGKARPRHKRRDPSISSDPFSRPLGGVPSSRDVGRLSQDMRTLIAMVNFVIETNHSVSGVVWRRRVGVYCARPRLFGVGLWGG